MKVGPVLYEGGRPDSIEPFQPRESLERGGLFFGVRQLVAALSLTAFFPANYGPFVVGCGIWPTFVEMNATHPTIARSRKRRQAAALKKAATSRGTPKTAILPGNR